MEFTRDYLEQGLRSVGLDWQFVDSIDEAEVLIMTKSQEKKSGRVMNEAKKEELNFQDKFKYKIKHKKTNL